MRFVFQHCLEDNAGGPGVGKTWIAREIRNLVDKNPSLCYGTLWTSMKRKYSGTRPFYEVIDRQWSVDPCDEEREDDAKEDEQKREEERLKRLVEGIQRKLKEIIPEKAKENASPKLNAFLLLVIDDIESREEENNIMGKLEDLLPGDQKSSLKVLITRREEASRGRDGPGV
ncbi:hypothetical protein CJ030_MR4G010528 [Morella rubra]|uniref:NACHT domain-containing protein n=1 Tax=Morella rubra TaxID=262757 RepID=A0A6A1VRC4_9ROSI|nr:hypothetical protein CJ030_MR4G010528 [Morella rubra]